MLQRPMILGSRLVTTALAGALACSGGEESDTSGGVGTATPSGSPVMPALSGGVLPTPDLGTPTAMAPGGSTPTPAAGPNNTGSPVPGLAPMDPVNPGPAIGNGGTMGNPTPGPMDPAGMDPVSIDPVGMDSGGAGPSDMGPDDIGPDDMGPDDMGPDDMMPDDDDLDPVNPGGGTFSVESRLASEEGSHLTTVGIVTWSLEGASVSDAHIEFGLDESYGMEAPVDLSEEGYRTLLLGMKGDTTYHFRIVANGGASVSEDYTITTGTVPGNVASVSFEAQAGSEPGFIILGSWQGSSTAFIIDSAGDIVWWYDSPASNVGRARMSADGKNMWMVAASNQGNPVYRVTMDGLDEESYDGIDADHDLTAVSGETMAFLDYGGSCDRIFEITPAGNPTMVFDSTDFVNGGGGAFGCHGNSVRYSAAEDVYIFSEHQQDVLVVNRDGSLAWRLSEEVGSNADWGGEQHGTHLLDDSIVIFANRGEGNNSTAIEYSLSDFSVINEFNVGLSTPNMGDVQRLPGGNTLLTFSNSGEIREVDASGNVVLSVTRGGGPNFGYTMWRASLYGPPPDIGM